LHSWMRTEAGGDARTVEKGKIRLANSKNRQTKKRLLRVMLLIIEKRWVDPSFFKIRPGLGGTPVIGVENCFRGQKYSRAGKRDFA